ncbi:MULTISPECIES: pilus assembly protein TadE [unclassified Blastococcus]|jgi:Flp pilus assembly protein TadG|uniref:pilus assembly protein TadE n=1 Tax=unclassified Blastococcus TaxID=2619396 RepID=UPI000DEB194C|nr:MULTISPECIES: pilus assembly protein TadE [unclassified Blastococcus]MBN1092133.1 pilus assembly protein TadE [Blastococcus sp. TML/M2B]MBN1097761.1 pilus assembly protein TadE [Blastococcus sp. TML/C7B]RBY91226.1 pilus assembly protein TadE [Blastococcus sp. TF02A-30]
MSYDLQPATNGRRRRWRDDRGSESVELAILLPVGLLLVAMLVIGARIALAGDRISGVAGIAARDASLARSAAAAQQIAADTATTALTSQGLHCIDVQVSVDTSGFTAPPGASASVTVAVTCTVDLSDIGGVAGLPGSRTLHDSATSPLDPARDPS